MIQATNNVKGALNWVFCDGDLPPKDGGALEAHEALMVVNLNGETANLSIDILFVDAPPKLGVQASVMGQRVRCFRLDQPLGDGEGFQIPPGQYAIALHSDIPVFAVFGRLDVRQPVAYYSVQGHTY